MDRQLPAELSAERKRNSDKTRNSAAMAATATNCGQTTTFGIISALHRACPGIENSDLVVTDALIERGNSGGPLFSLRGELVGIMVARAGDSDGAGYGFAIPLDAIRELLATVPTERMSAVR